MREHIPLLGSMIAMLLCKLDYSQLVGHSATLTFHSGKFHSHDRYGDNLTCCFPRSAVSLIVIVIYSWIKNENSSLVVYFTEFIKHQLLQSVCLLVFS